MGEGVKERPNRSAKMTASIEGRAASGALWSVVRWYKASTAMEAERETHKQSGFRGLGAVKAALSFDFREASNQFFRDGVDFPQGFDFPRVNLPVVLHCGGLTPEPEPFREQLHILDFGLDKDVHMSFLMGAQLLQHELLHLIIL